MFRKLNFKRICLTSKLTETTTLGIALGLSLYHVFAQELCHLLGVYDLLRQLLTSRSERAVRFEVLAGAEACSG